jgi:hypothetical protein
MSRVYLRLESLEWRDVPDGNPGDPPTSPPAQPPVNQAPQIVDLVIENAGHGLFLIHGRVVDEAPGGLTVTVGGSTSASGDTTKTLADGTFSMTVQLHTDGTDSGFLGVRATDAQGLVSDLEGEYVTP